MVQRVGWGDELPVPSRGQWYSRYRESNNPESGIQFVNRNTKEVRDATGRLRRREQKFSKHGNDEIIRVLSPTKTRVGRRIVITPRPANPTILPPR